MLPRRSRPQWDKFAAPRIHEERGRLRKTQEELAVELGVDRKTVGRWENGESSPSASQLKGMCELGMDTNYILTGRREAAVREPSATYANHDADALVEAYRHLHANERAAVRTLLDALARCRIGEEP